MIKKWSTLLEGNEDFKKQYFKANTEKLVDLAKNGQHPKALFIGCADSRVLPTLIIQADPGDLFVIRNVGNFVAPFKPDEDFHATASGIEYAVSILKVEEIIICGHTHCGAIHSLYQNLDDPSLIHTKKWLSLGEKAKSMAILSLGKDANREELYRLTEKISVVTQIENLLTYPSVKKAIDENKLNIHGWVYNMESGDIEYYDQESSEFLSLDLKES